MGNPFNTIMIITNNIYIENTQPEPEKWLGMVSKKYIVPQVKPGVDNAGVSVRGISTH
jgi:hypothetical protein